MISTIEIAIASIAESVPDASIRMAHGDESGIVLATSSQDMSGETIAADVPQEMRRVIGTRSDFPSVTRGSTVRLGDEMRLVTSARTDPVGASLSLGLSAAMDSIVATYRRDGTAMRQPVRVLAVESEVLDAWADNLAPTGCRAWFVCVSAEDWTEASEPQIGDELTIKDTRVKVANSARHDGYWLLTCRARR